MFFRTGAGSLPRCCCSDRGKRFWAELGSFIHWTAVGEVRDGFWVCRRYRRTQSADIFFEMSIGSYSIFFLSLQLFKCCVHWKIVLSRSRSFIYQMAISEVRDSFSKFRWRQCAEATICHRQFRDFCLTYGIVDRWSKGQRLPPGCPKVALVYQRFIRGCSMVAWVCP